jgi:hypothetical protein
VSKFLPVISQIFACHEITFAFGDQGALLKNAKLAPWTVKHLQNFLLEKLRVHSRNFAAKGNGAR